MLEVGISELRQAFARHRAANLRDPNPLLLFYATECGLKAVWMRRNNIRTTRPLVYLLSEEGHNLMYWAKELRLPRYLIEKPISFRLRRGPGSFGIELSHQAWRYGVQMVVADETSLIDWLMKISEWVGQELSI